MDNLKTEIKVTYLIGAGASALALPTVKKTESTNGISDDLKECANALKADKTISEGYWSFIDQMSRNLHWLAENSDKFGTPDTFAKFLYLKDKEELKRLKNTLGFYFSFKQLFEKKFDTRALSFITTLLQDGNRFPQNVKILNWNYDFQIQLGTMEFRKEEYRYDGNVAKHTPPLIRYYPSYGNEIEVNNYKFNLYNYSMVHLNGIAGFYYDQDNKKHLSHFMRNEVRDINDFIAYFYQSSSENVDLLTFAWEDVTESVYYLRSRLPIAKKMIEETDVLVIIGYSFPFFNRNIDKEIFETLKASRRLKKIYYQDKYKAPNFIKNQFNLPDDIDIVGWTDTDQYLVPFEF